MGFYDVILIFFLINYFCSAKSVTFAHNILQNISFLIFEMLQSNRKFLKHLFLEPLGSMTIFPLLDFQIGKNMFHQFIPIFNRAFRAEYFSRIVVILKKTIGVKLRKVSKVTSKDFHFSREGKVRYDCRTKYEGKVRYKRRDILGDDPPVIKPRFHRASSSTTTPALLPALCSQQHQVGVVSSPRDVFLLTAML